jgi:hypothetical protein
MQVLLFRPWDVQQAMYASKHAIQYQLICALLERMYEADFDMDEEQFRIVCVALRSAAESVGKGLPRDVRADIFTTGLHRLRTMFQGMVSTYAEPSTFHQRRPTIPIAPHIPSPTTLHAYARALGALHDYEGIYSFTTWLSSNQREITKRAQAQFRGLNHLRGTLKAVRKGLDGFAAQGQLQKAPEELVLLVRDQIEDLAEWGGWPSDEEMALYREGTRKRIRTIFN